MAAAVEPGREHVRDDTPAWRTARPVDGGPASPCVERAVGTVAGPPDGDGSGDGRDAGDGGTETGGGDEGGGPVKRVDVTDAGGFFDVVASTDRSQAARMVLQPGQSTGGPTNAHADSDQWLVVLSGRGTATVAGESVPLDPGTLLLLEAGETHEVGAAAGADDPLVTVSVYAPPAY
jgi:mannose-6-phosphate isomerase-like protein (cupin superfamily)